MNEIKCPKCGTVFQIDETDYESILKQIRDHEFEKQIQEREKLFSNEKENEIKIKTAELELKIKELENEIKIKDTEKESEILKITSQKDQDINELKKQIDLNEKEYELEKKNAKERYEIELKQKDTEVEFYKDLKAKQSTKMIGETLEQHCNAEFEKIRPMFSNKTYFEKDNDAKTGSKGDFIFKDYDEDGNEIISIMFEMKNEADMTATKHKNEDFFKELDKDRKEKNCEYAVLVSLLEIDSEIYNTGIVDVSHKYEKMYVIRPQFFVPMITLLRNAALKSMEYKKELVTIQNQNIDITHFEENINIFKEGFSRNYRLASERFSKAIEEIDKTIANLEKVKENLRKTDDNLRLANNKAEDLTIKKLTHNNETMKKMFEDLKKE